ncbi:MULTISPECIES: hypothetical protein [Priestia]|uniref:hypothetical protein n=1 Tax=Priestia TaxID=2800373 RepID=UPI0005ED34D1|nr:MULTISPECIES: hypothetical protein [Priestia]KJL06799.1 hypothetical protein N178_01350 [Priestia aryabhattai B8W22]MED3893707.1 hypothetical protein [Priestia aryabhattai]
MHDGQATVYASWNGSTETVAWQVLAGPTPFKLAVVVFTAPRTGFETDIHAETAGPYFQVKALYSCGNVIGTSPTTYVKIRRNRRK